MCQAKGLGPVLAAILCGSQPDATATQEIARPAPIERLPAKSDLGAPKPRLIPDKPAVAEPPPPKKPAPVRVSVPEKALPPAAVEPSAAAKANQWTLGLAAGDAGSIGVRMAADLARHLNEPEGLRILPLITAGEADNVQDLMLLRNVDAAIVHVDALARPVAGVEEPALKLGFVAELFISPVHVLARRGIETVADLDGRAVATGPRGAAAMITAPRLFERIGISARFVVHDYVQACAGLADGSVDAVVHVGETLPEPCRRLSAASGVSVLAVPLKDLAGTYPPIGLPHDAAPNLIRTAEVVDSVGVPAVLAVYLAPRDTPRFRKVARLVDLIGERFEALKGAGHPAWHDVNLAAHVPGWTRHPHAETRFAVSETRRPAAQAQARP